MSTNRTIRNLLAARIEELEGQLRYERSINEVNTGELRYQEERNQRLNRQVDEQAETIDGLMVARDWLVAELDVTKGKLRQVLVDHFDPSTLAGLDKIPAIKQVREELGLGLKEAKDLVDGFEATGMWTRPTAEELEALSDQQDAAFRERVAARLEEAGISSSDITGEEGRTTYVTD